MSATMMSRTAFGTRTAGARTVRSRSLRQVTVAAAKPNWLPGSTTPAYLDGLPASYGFDPLKLGEDPAALRWYQQAEIIHCRWAMLGAAGVMFTSVLPTGLPVWYEAGAASQASSPIPFATNLAILHILVGFVEAKRWMDIRKPGSQGEPGSFLGLEGALKGKEVGYPGGIFDPAGFSNGESYETLKVKEIKNGRLAMMACLGFFAQYKATGEGPGANLAAHLANPWGVNFTTNGVSLPF